LRVFCFLAGCQRFSGLCTCRTAGRLDGFHINTGFLPHPKNIEARPSVCVTRSQATRTGNGRH